MMKVDKQHELIAKMLSNNISEEEKELFQQWLQEDGNNVHTYEQAKKAWELVEHQLSFANTENAWLKLNELIVGDKKQEVVKLNPLLWFSRIAAVLIAVIGIIFLYNTYFFEQPIKTFTTTNEMVRVVLPDQSIVWLNKKSEISFPEKFTGKKREVKLNGEAFFEVAHNNALPFIIETNSTLIQDIGTSFNVRAFTIEKSVEVTVATGEVSFGRVGNKRRIHLLPGDKGVFDPISNALSSSRNTDANFLAWKTNKLVFDKTYLRDVAITLGKFYNENFTANADAESILFTGTFDQISLNDAIKIIETSTGTQIIKRQNGYIILAE